MLTIKVPMSQEEWDEVNEVFIEPETVPLTLEHSLASISKWESKWHKPFFEKREKTTEETHDYIQHMVVTENVDPEIFKHLTERNYEEIYNYIENPMTATTFVEDAKSKSSKKIMTAERIYCLMFSYHIPLEFENRHINQLLTLLRVFDAENTPSKKMSPKEAIARNKAINAKNKAILQSKGR